jgi:hypothetical protein
MPEAEGPEEDRDEVLNPTMDRPQTARRRRQMGRRGVKEDTDQDVDHDENARCAEKGFQKAHINSPPLCVRWSWCG